jgi:AcrR family transcriptional regulator
MEQVEPEGRVAKRQRRNREAVLQAGHDVMSEKGIDAATMQEIAARADVGAGTVYSYFKSKDELAIAVLELVMQRLAVRIEAVTDTFADPAQVYAFGIRIVLETATADFRWKQLLHRSEVIADALYRCMGPFAIRDLRRAAAAGRIVTPDPELTWRMTSHAIVGIALAITKGELPPDAVDRAIIGLLCMTGIEASDASELTSRPRPELGPESVTPKKATR